MKRYDEKVLNSLLDKYENSLLYTGQNQRKHSIEFPVKKSTLPEYFDETSMQFELVHAQLADMEEKGFVRLIWRKGKEGHILEKCLLQTERAEEIYAWLQRRTRKQKEEDVIHICREYRGRHPALDAFLQYVEQRIGQGQSVAQYVDMDHPQQLPPVMLRQVLSRSTKPHIRFPIHITGQKGNSRFLTQILPYQKAATIQISEMPINTIRECPVQFPQKLSLRPIMITAQINSKRPFFLPPMEGGQVFNRHDSADRPADIPTYVTDILTGQTNTALQRSEINTTVRHDFCILSADLLMGQRKHPAALHHHPRWILKNIKFL